VSLALILSTWLAATVPASPRPVRAVDIEGAAVQGIWSGVSPDGAVVLDQDGRRKEVPPGELMLLRWAAPPVSPPVETRPTASRPAPASQPAAVFLTDGNHLQGTVIGGDARHIVFKTALVPELTLPLDRVAAVRLMPREHPAAAEAFSKALAARDPAEDTLLIVRDDRVTALKGVTESLAPSGGSFKWRQRRVPIRADNAYGIIFAAGVQKPAPQPAMATLIDGSTWAGRLVGGDAKSVSIELAGGLKVPLPVKQISEIRFRSDRVLFLSDLEPAEYVFEPFSTTRWPYRRDRSVANRLMRIGDQSFDRGIGMHSKSTLTYDLPGEFSRLAAVIGIDAGAAPLGNAVFRVTADGKEVFNSGPVTGRDAPRPINVSVAGAKRVQLIVDFGEDLDIGDQADWGNVRLVK
jgi:hypothetical protein